MEGLPKELQEKIFMYSLPSYPYLRQLKETRFYRSKCDCEGCNFKHYYGCYYFETFNYRHKLYRNILKLNSVPLLTVRSEYTGKTYTDYDGAIMPIFKGEYIPYQDRIVYY